MTPTLWHSRRVSIWFVLSFAAWLGIGTWVSLPSTDPAATFEAKIRLRRQVDDDLTLSGRLLHASFRELGRRAFLTGHSRLEYRRTNNIEPGFLVLTLSIDIPPGSKFTVRNTTTGDELVLEECPGWMTHLGIPVTGARVRFELIPSDDRIVYRFPQLMCTHLLPRDDRPFELTVLQEFSPAIALEGGKLAIGAGWEVDPGDLERQVPGGVLTTRNEAWLEFAPGRPGPCTVRIPFQKVRGSDPDPIFEMSGSPVAAETHDGVAALRVQLDAKARLCIRRPRDAKHPLEPVYVVAVAEITIER